MSLHRSIAGALASLCFVLAGAANALGADRAQFDVIGYSNDQRFFAFEEYGVQDGSGFAYANVYAIDLTDDTWVIGTPVRAQASDEATPLAAVIASARKQAQGRLDDLGIGVPATLLAANGDGDVGRDGLSLEFGLPSPLEPRGIAGDYKLSFDIYTADSGAPCMEWFGDKAKGFTLKLFDGAMTREVHRDDVLPRSRGCPVTYAITAVFVPFNAQSLDRAMALISVHAHGFEGLDRRFVAVPLGASGR